MRHSSILTLALTLTALAACGDDEDPITGTPGAPSKTYSATVTGDLSKTLSGPAAFGTDTDDEGNPVFAVALGGPDSENVLLMVREGGTRPGAGTYEFAESFDEASSKWTALYIIGADDELVGVFLAETGTLTITDSSAQRLKGTFQIEAVGFMADDFETEVSITMTGSFDAGAAANASLYLDAVRVF